MKPDWKDAPEWANWLAMDENGRWCWYSHSPVISDGMNIWTDNVDECVYEYAKDNINWKETLEERP